MNKLSILAVVLLCSQAIHAQVGIGTLSPNTKSLLELSSTSKGLLLPRMSSTERANMSLASADAGMMVYQTTSPKGLYTWDGAGWIYSVTVEPGTTNGYTLRWDGTKWAQASNLFNTGSNIIIGNLTSTINQFQIHATATANTRIQLTNAATGSQSTRGLLIGIGNTNLPGVAHILQQENKPLWLGTNNIERMRIDSAGRVGINTTSPSTTFDVNGSFKLGTNGSEIQNIMRMDILVDPPPIAPNDEWIASLACPYSTVDGVVYVSPGSTIDHIVIAYARVSSPGTIEVKMVNMMVGPNDNNPPPVMLHIAVIQ